ncbi:cytochrome P450 18a1-like [Rhipicephalus sanguineus]|uniref:cytochrome P450 18a1-like n=1 Tax=Rhipicephalus sanguineus TaxID=34632 RepID=UPI001893409F|nr:cytochrome P450 18a1-like [Rhipicephalus sanguineus]
MGENCWLLVTACLAVFCFTSSVLRLFIVTSRKQEKKLPPGPRGLPMLGYLPFIRKLYHEAFKELSEKYGPIIRLRLGCREVVVLNDLDSIRAGLNNPDVLYRPNNFIMSCLGVKGITSLNGEPWQVNRRYCFHALRNLGFAKKSMEAHIQEEIKCFVNLLASAEGQPMVVAKKLAASVCNNISALVFGQRYELDDPRCHYIEGLVSTFMRYASVLSLLDFLPTVRSVCNYIPYTKIGTLNDVVKNMKQAIRTEVKKREKNMESYFERDFIDGYLRKTEENKGTNSHLNMDHLEGNVINLYGAATNTVRVSILWNLYVAASDPDGMQAQVQRETDAVIGREKPIEWEDRRSLPFTMASVLETLRWRTTTPIGIHRITMSDTEICGYHVSAGTFVIANFWSLHNDSAHWYNPFQYDPTRFLNSDGTELAEKPVAFLPFSVGRRACPGETLGLMEVFLYVATLLQHFRVLPENGKVISLEPTNRFLAVVNDTQKLRFVRRGVKVLS